MLDVMHVLMRVLRNPRRIEESGHVELSRRMRVRREQKMHVVALGEARAPRFAELRRPRGPVARTRRLRERVQLPVEHRELVRRIALVARAAKAEAKRELDDIDVRLWPHEPHRRYPRARELEKRFDRTAQVRPHKRPSEAPPIFRVDISRRDHLSLHGVGLRPGIALVARSTELEPRPALDRWIRIRALPRKRREA